MSRPAGQSSADGWCFVQVLREVGEISRKIRQQSGASGGGQGASRCADCGRIASAIGRDGQISICRKRPNGYEEGALATGPPWGRIAMAPFGCGSVAKDGPAPVPCAPESPRPFRRGRLAGFRHRPGDHHDIRQDRALWARPDRSQSGTFRALERRGRPSARIALGTIQGGKEATDGTGNRQDMGKRMRQRRG